ncbi:hypothetical protein F5X68DRAFT_7772 [Plectosphaerella plurivora]|uniref:Protein kinase domain-containing protein n=1 Tax=Plectosphaerella plurivora TaxID=936078 RepID=A0A9P8VBC6_9PEZI|nr:hypothetical protein F5X68DRAFT_7772 [Plectosphaerella plurivora]
MAQIAAVPTADPPPQQPGLFLLRRLFGRNNEASGTPDEAPTDQGPGESGPEGNADPELESDADHHGPRLGNFHLHRGRPVVPGLPRAQTFKRQQSEKRVNLAPIEPTTDERRAVSVDRRFHQPRSSSRSASQQHSFPRSSAPELLDNAYELQSAHPGTEGILNEKADHGLQHMPDTDLAKMDVPRFHDLCSAIDPHDAMSITTSQWDAQIHEELETRWILNLSMHFRDKSKREKFFVTYREMKGENDQVWRRVTISLDYRSAPENSLELELATTKYQRDKSAKIYESIRESLQDIQFYDTVTNLKLQTTDGRLHVHVVEDTNEIIPYPNVRQVHHLGCRLVRESDIDFDAHMSGFVYRVKVGNETLIKKEIPGPETVDEFLYEINALHSLRDSPDVIQFFGVVVDEQGENVKGLLISYADQGALVDVLFDNRQDSELGTPWPIRERWARQIVQGLADIHECGFVQGDFTLSNIVIDHHEDAKIIDINRRGCPVGWEPPEATALIECGQRLSMYIGVKSDLFQLGMVLWALATQEDEPEIHGRPLQIDPELSVPGWFEDIVYTCLSSDPRQRLQASALLSMFPPLEEPESRVREVPTSISVDDGFSTQEYFIESFDNDGQSGIKSVKPPSDWSYVNLGNVAKYPQDPYRRSRGRSPPSPLPSHLGQFDHFGKNERLPSWARGEDMPHSYSDVSGDNASDVGRFDDLTPTTAGDIIATPETLSAHLPAVVVETADGLVEVTAADNSGVMTPESLAVEHHNYGGNEPDAAKTPTPRAREYKEHSFMEAWVRSTASCSPTSMPPPMSPSAAVEGSQVHDIQSLVLEPVPDDLPKLDDKSEHVTVVTLEAETAGSEKTAAVDQDEPAAVQAAAQKEAANIQEETSVVAPEETPVVPKEATILQEEKTPSVVQEEPSAIQKDTAVLAQEQPLVISEVEPAVAQEMPAVAAQADTITIPQDDAAVVAQEEPAVVPEDGSVQEKPVEPVATQEETAALAQEDSPIVQEETATIVAQEEPPVVTQEMPAVTAQEDTTAVPQDDTAVVVPEQTAVLNQEEPAAVAQEEPAAVAQEEPAAVAQEEPATVAQEEAPVVNQVEPAEIQAASANVAQQDTTPLVQDEPPPLVSQPEQAVAQDEPAIVQEEPAVVAQEAVVTSQEEPAVVQGDPTVAQEEPVVIGPEESAVITQEQSAATDQDEPAIITQDEVAVAKEEPAVHVEAAAVQGDSPVADVNTEQKMSEDTVLREQEKEADRGNGSGELLSDQIQEAPLPLVLDSGLTAPEGAPDHSNGPQSDKSDATAIAPPPKVDEVRVGEEKGPSKVEGQLDNTASKKADDETCAPVSAEAAKQQPDDKTPALEQVATKAEDLSLTSPAKDAALEGIGAAHVVTGSADAEPREQELRDDDLLGPMTAAVASTPTPPSTTTATTEGSGMTPAL